MKLIADSGSTKTNWACLRKDGTCTRFTSAGYNPNYITADYMTKDIGASLPKDIDKNDITEIYFYGAGVTELQFPFVRKILLGLFPKAVSVFVEMDLLASARALLGDSPGFAAILGTGTNSCLYDGNKVTLNIDSLGFILGDEGSGGYMGKQLMIDFIRHNMPDKVWQTTYDYLKMSGDEIIDQIYTKPFPNRWCAQFSRFIEDHLHDEDPYFLNLVRSSFDALFDKIISHYPNYKQYDFNSVGSIAYCFHDILEDVVSAYGMKMGKIVRYPIDGLIQYHREHY
jgi:glucosamine kinase